MAMLMNGAYFNSLDQESGLQNALKQIPNSGTTDYIIFSLNVNSSSSADINFGLTGPVLASGGVVQQGTSDIITPIVSAGVKQGSCQRVWLSIGGWGSNAFTNINDILEGPADNKTTLFNNFKAIIAAIEGIEGANFAGFDLDFEQAEGDLHTLVSNMTIAFYNEFNCKFTFCPFQHLPARNQAVSPWISSLSTVYSALHTQPVVGFNLQIYAGGTGNDPTAWVKAVAAESGTGVADASSFIWPIFSCDTTAPPNVTPSQATSDMQGWKSQGASLWATAALPYEGYDLGDYATAIAAG